MKTKMYGLRLRGDNKLLGFTTYAQEGGECVDVRFELSVYGDTVWLIQNKEDADYVAKHSTPWYNASYDRPVNNYIGQIEVVEILMEFR